LFWLFNCECNLMDSIFGTSLGTPVVTQQKTTGSPQSASSSNALNSFSYDLQSSGVSGGVNSGGSRSAFGDILSRGDPVLAYEWEGMIIDKGNPEPIPYVYIESIQAPNIQFELDHRFFHGRNLSYPAQVLTDNLVVQLYNDSTGAAAALVSSWAEETFMTASGGFRLPSEFKKAVKVNIHDPKRNQVYSMMFGGCFPVSMGHASAMDYKSSEPNSFVLTLSVDYVYLSA